MKAIYSGLLIIALSGCASLNQETYDDQYSASDIAEMSSDHFDVSLGDMGNALKPAFKKYGAPHGYVDGLMSSIDSANANYLYGSGHFKTKLRLREHTFWRVDGENLSGHLSPVKTAHLVYKARRLDPLSNSFEFSETLTKRGQKFTVFERKLGDEIVITFHKTADLPKSKLQSVSFFHD
jgi:hypothetical protein